MPPGKAPDRDGYFGIVERLRDLRALPIIEHNRRKPAVVRADVRLHVLDEPEETG